MKLEDIGMVMVDSDTGEYNVFIQVNILNLYLSLQTNDKTKMLRLLNIKPVVCSG